MILFLQKALLYSIPLREMAGFRSGIPLRVGELLIVSYIVYIFFTTSIERKLKVFNSSKLNLIIIGALFFNLILVFLISRRLPVNKEFLYKYLARNFVMLSFLISILIKPIRLNRKILNNFFKYMVMIQLLMFFLQLIGWNIEFFTLVNFSSTRRYQGTASEAGYLPTLIAPTLCYFRNSIKNKRYYYLAFFEIAMTFSSFGYFVLAIELLISITRRKTKLTNKSILTFVGGSILVFVVLVFKWDSVEKKVNYSFQKILKYSQGQSYDFSVKARNEQLEYIKARIDSIPTTKKIFGAGTGRYSQIMGHEVKKDDFFEIADEAHTLYWSTIHDRGLIGITLFCGILLSLGLMIYKQRNNKVIMSFSYIYILQIIHWKLTANMWLYFFWITAAFIISQYELKEKIELENTV